MKKIIFTVCTLFGILGTASNGVFAEQAAATVTPEMQTLNHAILKQLIEINTTANYGTTAAAKAIAERLLEAGFPADDVQLLAPDNHPERANVVVRLRGQNKAKPLLFIGHLDVVEALREDWTLDPFRLTEQDGWLYGRGTIDMKGQDSVVLTSLIALKKQGFVPERDIIAAFTADEEQGDANGVEWLLEAHRPLVDAGLVINPDGGEAGLQNGKHLYLVMQTSEKIYATFKLEVTDKGGHSSAPTAANPIYRLARALEKLSTFRFPVDMTATNRLYFERRSRLEQGQLRDDMLQMSRPHPGKAVLERLSANSLVDILMRTTCTATMIQGGHAENALPQRAEAMIQCRIVPGESPELIRQTLARVVNDKSMSIQPVTRITLSPESKPDPAVLAPLEKLVHSMWPGVEVIPQMSPGASDSIYTRAAGIPTFGIDAMFTDIDDDRFHGKDERISEHAFNEELEFMYRLMRDLSVVP